MLTKALAHRAAPITALVAIYLIAIAVYVAMGRKHTVPNLFPDELFYGHLSRSLAAGDGLTWRGIDWGLPPLWPALLSVVWGDSSIPDGYAAAHRLGAVVCSLAVVPVWLLARTFVGARLALIPAALTLAGTWMHSTLLLASENLTFPLAVAALACIVMSLRDVRMRWIYLAIAFSGIAVLVRTQMLALPVILVIALVLDVLRQPRAEWRERMDARPRALWLLLLAGLFAGLGAFVVNPELTHYDVLANGVSVGDVVATAGRQTTTSVLMFGLVPVLAAVGLMGRKRNWHDDTTGPILATLVAGTVVFIPTVARFEAWATVGIPVERYLMYLAPLFLLALVLAPGRISRRTAIVVAVAAAAAAGLAPASRNYVEQPALFGTHIGLYHLGGWIADHTRLATAFAAVVLLVPAAVALADARVRRGLAVAVALTLGVFIGQAWATADFEARRVDFLRNAVAPQHRDWVDRAASTEVGVLAVGKSVTFNNNEDVFTEFFNRKVTRVYSDTAAANGVCQATIPASGLLGATAGRCEQLPREWVLADSPYRLTLRDQRVITDEGKFGRLVAVPPGPQKMLAAVRPPCWRGLCTGSATVGLFLDDAAELAVRFGAAPTPHRVARGSKIYTLPAGQAKTLRFSLTSGRQQLVLPVDWTVQDGAPKLQRATLESGGATVRIY